MPKRSNENAPPPLPQEWLPEAAAPAGAVEWETRSERIMAVAEPKLQRLGRRVPTSEPSWWSALGWWWKPAAVVASATAAVLFVLDAPVALREPTPDSLSLMVIAAAGEPIAFWEMLGVEADPVLALIAWQEQAP